MSERIPPQRTAKTRPIIPIKQTDFLGLLAILEILGVLVSKRLLATKFHAIEYRPDIFLGQ